MFALILGCASPADSAAAEGSSGTTLDLPEPPAPSWDEAEVALRAETVLAGGVPDPFAISDLYLSLFDHGEEFCPARIDYSMSAPFEGCTTSEGWEYAGFSLWSSTDAPATLSVESDVTVTAPTGERFVGAGKLSYESDGTVWSAAITGTWGMPGAGGWLESVPGIAMWSESDGATLTLTGGYNTGLDQVYLDPLTWTPEGCDQPMGVLRLRDPSGYWYALTLDDCSGCGIVDYEDEALGEACVDLAPAMTDFVARIEAQ